MKRLLIGDAILLVFTFAVSYKISADFANSIKAEIQTVKAQNKELKTELQKINKHLEYIIFRYRHFAAR